AQQLVPAAQGDGDERHAGGDVGGHAEVVMTALFPSRSYRRTRERASGLLFAFGVDDLSTELPSGQTLTFDRNSSKTVLDSAGRVATLAYDQVPWAGWYNTVAARWEPVMFMDNAATNLCLQSENFGAT